MGENGGIQGEGWESEKMREMKILRSQDPWNQHVDVYLKGTQCFVLLCAKEDRYGQFAITLKSTIFFTNVLLLRLIAVSSKMERFWRVAKRQSMASPWSLHWGTFSNNIFKDSSEVTTTSA